MLDIVITPPHNFNHKPGEYHIPKLAQADVLREKLEASKLCSGFIPAIDPDHDIVGFSFNVAKNEDAAQIIAIVDAIYGAGNNLSISVLPEGQLHRQSARKFAPNGP